MACRQWQRNQQIADDEFTRAWTPYVWKRARDWCRRNHLPDHHVEEYVSAGFAALASVPPTNRWSSRYVMTAIRNRMFSAARRRNGQPHHARKFSSVSAPSGLQSSLAKLDPAATTVADVLVAIFGTEDVLDL